MSEDTSWPTQSGSPLEDVRETVQSMRARADGENDLADAMCRLSLPMAEWLLAQLDLAAKVFEESASFEGFLVIESLQGNPVASGWVYSGQRPRDGWDRVFWTFGAAKRQVDRLQTYSKRDEPWKLRWSVVNADQWLLSPVDAEILYSVKDE